jgi:tetratricopeptide (TPR) repeat protein
MNERTGIRREPATQPQPKAWPVLSGTVPSLADGYTRRPETGSGPWDALHPGLTVILGPDRDARSLAMGLDGTGKTQLAAAFAHKLWGSAELDLLVWLDAGSRDSLIMGYARALADIRVAAPPGKPEAAAAQFLAWLADTGKRWLVVVDGLVEPADAAGLWPQGPSGQVVVTTSLTRLIPSPVRSGNAGQAPASRTAKPLSVAVGPFSQREAMEYLSGRLNYDPYQASGSLDLAISMDLLPAALALAVAYMLDSGHDCGRYRLDYEKYRRNRDDGIASDPLAPAWVLAVDRAQQLAPTQLAWPALKLAAVLGPAGIPGAVLTSSAACSYLAGQQSVSHSDQASAQAAFSNLQRLGLVTIEPEDEIRTLRMSAALVSSVRQGLRPAELRQAVQTAADAIRQVWPDSESQADMEQALRDCATSVRRCDELTLWNAGCHPLMVRAGQSLDSAPMAETAAAYWRDLAARSAKYHGAASLLTFQLRERLASAAAATGRTDEAISLREELTDDIDEVAGPAHPQAITSRASLARLFRRAGRLSEAISLGSRVTADSEYALGLAHEQTTASLRELASAYFDAGQYREAIGVFQRCLSLRAQTLGLMHAETLSVRYQLAETYRQAGQGNEALRLYQKMLAQVENAVGTSHPDTVTAREHLAIAHYRAGQTDQAAATLEQALAEWRRVPGSGPESTIVTRANLAAIYCMTGRLKEAIRLYQSEIADLEQIYGPAHSDTLHARWNLAAAYHKVKRIPDAIELGQATLADCERALGTGHPETLTTRANLAHAYHSAGQLKRASAHFDRALRDCEQAVGLDEPLTRTVRMLRTSYLAGRQGTTPIVAPPQLLLDRSGDRLRKRNGSRPPGREPPTAAIRSDPNSIAHDSAPFPAALSLTGIAAMRSEPVSIAHGRPPSGGTRLGNVAAIRSEPVSSAHGKPPSGGTRLGNVAAIRLAPNSMAHCKPPSDGSA